MTGNRFLFISFCQHTFGSFAFAPVLACAVAAKAKEPNLPTTSTIYSILLPS